MKQNLKLVTLQKNVEHDTRRGPMEQPSVDRIKPPRRQNITLNKKTILSDPDSPVSLCSNSFLHTPEKLPGRYLNSLPWEQPEKK